MADKSVNESIKQLGDLPHRQSASNVLKAPINKRQAGFDCEFIERPQKAFQTDCPICLLVLRQPQQVTCCGYSFCRNCIPEICKDRKPCPTCNQVEFSVFPNKGLQRSLYEFHVWCTHEKEGCQWTGELGKLENHLNESPQHGDQLRGCPYTEVECCQCAKHFQCRGITTHEIEECLQRPFSCDYCGDYEADYESVVTEHWPVCSLRPVPCPNVCGVYPERQNLEQHISKNYPLAIVNCDFHYAGCEVLLPRKDMSTHLSESLVVHISFWPSTIKRGLINSSMKTVH